MCSKEYKSSLINYLSPDLGKIIKNILNNNINDLEEIRIRNNKPIMIYNSKGEWFLNTDGSLTKNISNNLFITSIDDINTTIELMSENSIYAFQNDIKNGFITLKGGHRVGIVGKVILENEKIKFIKDISSINIRISKEILGCAIPLIKYIIEKNKVFNTLIISPPQCGKTTIIRDITRLLSNGIKEYRFPGVKVVVVDERSEIAAVSNGIEQNDIGIRTDVLDSCPKVIGMKIILRSMSPNVIITDEIGNEGDAKAIMEIVNAGINIITTAHGFNLSEFKARKEVLYLINEKVFDRYIVLSNKNGPGTLNEVFDGNLNPIFRR